MEDSWLKICLPEKKNYMGEATDAKSVLCCLKIELISSQFVTQERLSLPFKNE